MTRIRSKLTYANVMSSIAVFAVLGGGAYAASKIGPKDIKKNAVRSKHIKNKQVNGADIAPGAVKRSRIATGAVGPEEIDGGAVGSSEIEGGAVGSSEIDGGAVGRSEIALDAVDRLRISPAAKAYWARVNADGTLVAGGGFGITVDKGTNGLYDVNFPTIAEPFHARAVVGTPTTSLAGILVQIGEFDHTPTGTTVPVQVFNVFAEDPGDRLIDHPFTIAAIP